MNQVILKPYSVMRIINIVMVLKLTIHRYIRNGSIKKLIRKGLRRWNYSTGKKTVLIFIPSLPLVKSLQVNEWWEQMHYYFLLRHNSMIRRQWRSWNGWTIPLLFQVLMMRKYGILPPSNWMTSEWNSELWSFPVMLI